jgi:hypothetical protein
LVNSDIFSEVDFFDCELEKVVETGVWSEDDGKIVEFNIESGNFFNFQYL